MSEETAKADAADISQIGTALDGSIGTLPTQPPQAGQKDVVMSDAPLEQPAVGDLPYYNLHLQSYSSCFILLTRAQSSPAPLAHAPSPLPARTGTPVQSSRAASAHPDPGFSMPAEAPPHGDATRRYLNTKVTGVLLEGMKQLAKDK